MATRNLLVDWLNNKKNAVSDVIWNIQNVVNKASATNVSKIKTPNSPTLPQIDTSKILRKAVPAQTATPVQTASNLNTNIVQPVQNNTTVGWVWTVAPMPQQQSRFIWLQQTQPEISASTIVKPSIFIPTAAGNAWRENKKEEKKFRTTEQALLDFQADVMKKKGKMKDADIKRLYPEFADRLDVMKELQTELRPIVKNWQGVDGEQLAQYYPELIQPKNLKDTDAITKESERSNKKLQSNIASVEKVVTESYDVLSPAWQKYVQDYLTLAWVLDSLKSNYRILWWANDDEILQYAIENNPKLKWVAEELESLHLTEMDKSYLWKSWDIITNLMTWLQKMVREARTATQNFATEQNYLAEQTGDTNPNFFNTTWNSATNILWAADQTTTAGARFFWNQNVDYNIDKEAQEAVEKQEISDMLAMWWWYWKTIWGIASAPFEYWKLTPITKPIVEKWVEPFFEFVSDAERTITNPVWNELWLSEQDKGNADAILLWEILREFKAVKKDVKVRAKAAKDIVGDAFNRTVKSNKRSEMKNEFQKAWVYDEAWYIKPEAKVQAAKIIAREFAKDFTENFKNNASQRWDVVDFYRKREWVKSYKEQINDIKQWAKDVVDTVKETGKKAWKTIAEWIDKGFDKMDESIEKGINNIKNKVTREKTTEIKAEEKAPAEAGRSQPKKWVVSKVVWWVTAVWNKINEKVVDPLSTKVAEWITSTTAPQDKLFKALNPSVNVLSRKKGNYETIRKNADRANELIVEYGDTPTNSKDYYDSIVNTKKKIWNNWIQQGLDEYKYTTIDAKDLINPVREALKEFTAEPLEALKGDVKKLEAELQAIESKGIISLLEMETKKRQINAILEYWLPPDASQIYEKWMRELNKQIWIQEDRMISELPWEFSKFKRDYGALTAIEEDAQKLMIKDMKKKLGGNLIQNWSRIEGLGKMGKAMVWNGSFLEWAAQIILWESLGKVKDTNFLIKSWFEGLRGQYKWGTTKPEWVKIKKKPPTPKLEDKRTDIEKWKIAELDMRSDENKKEWYSRKEEKKNVVTKKSAVTEKKPEPKKEEIVEKKETPKAEKELETRVETKKPEPKQEPKKETKGKEKFELSEKWWENKDMLSDERALEIQKEISANDDTDPIKRVWYYITIDWNEVVDINMKRHEYPFGTVANIWLRSLLPNVLKWSTVWIVNIGTGKTVWKWTWDWKELTTIKSEPVDTWKIKRQELTSRHKEFNRAAKFTNTILDIIESNWWLKDWYLKVTKEPYEPLYIEEIGGGKVAIGQTYIQEWDVMFDPEIVFGVDENGKLQAETYRNDGLWVYDKPIQPNAPFLETWEENLRPFIKSVAKSGNGNIIGKNNSLTTNNPTNEQQKLWWDNQWLSKGVLWSDRPLSMNERDANREKDYAWEISRDLRKEQLDNDAISKGQSAWPAIWQQQRILTKSEARTINQNAKEILANHNYSTNPKDYSKEALEILRQYEWAGGLTKVWEDTTWALDQFYTPQAAIDAVWHLVDMYKDESNRYDVLEPTVWTGRFIRDHADENYEWHEIDKVPWTIAQILHPDARIQVWDFEDQFMDFTGRVPQDFWRRVDIVVWNPPYSQRMSKQQKAWLEPKIKRSEEFFIKKWIDILTNWGMLAMVVPSTFLRNPMDYAKEEILKQASLVDAYRLPEWVFPYTQVGTDIIVFKKNKSGSDSIADNKWFEEHPEKVLGEEKERISRFGNLEKYVDWWKNPLEMLNAIYEDKKAVEPTPEMQAKEYSPTKSIESKPVEQKTTTQVTWEKNKVTAKTPVKRTTKPWTKIDKQTIIKWEKTDLIDTVFGEWDVDERLIEYSKKTDINWYVQWPALELVEKDPKNLNFYKYHAVINDLYFAWNIREKLDTLEREKADLSEAQYKKQKEWLLAALPEQYTVENHPYVSPLDTNVMSMETDDTYESYEWYNQTKTKHFTVKDLFLDWFRTNVSYNTMNKRLAQEYINWEAMRSGSSNTYGLTDKEKAAKLRHEKSVVMEQTNELFNEWLWTKLDKKMQEKIIDKFNKENRSYVLPKYDKMPLPLKWISETFMGDKFVPKEAQIEAINFLLSKWAWIAALWVGWWKTIVGTIATREAQLRWWNKRPMIIWPAPTLYAQWVRTIREQYPDWEIVNLWGLTVDDIKRLKRDLWDDPVNWIKDWQVAVISREWLANGIDFKPRTRMELEMDLKDVMEDKSKKAKKTARAEESLKKKIEQWLAPWEWKADKHIYHENAEFLRTSYNRMLDMNKQEFFDYFKDAVKEEYKDLPENVALADAEALRANRPIFIEDLWIDHLTVDEMHNFKNVFASAKMDEDENWKKWVNRYSNIIQGSSSERWQKLYLASQYVMKNNWNRNVFWLTATPFNNQPIEIYNMLSMVGKNELEKMWLTNINDFFSKFAEFKEWLAPNAAGTELEYKFVMKDFANKRDLQRLITQFVLFKWDSQDLVRPEYRLRTPVIEMSDEQKLAQAGLEVKALDNADKWDVLSATNWMIGNLVTPFMVKWVRAPTWWKDFIDNSAKLKFIAEAIKNLRDMWNEDWCFIYMPKWVEFHETYREALANITGTPKEKIWIINTNTKARKDEIAQAFRDGRINILIWGKNTAEWIDLQDRGYITFITDVGRNTTERTQVDGRIWRQNNNNSHVLSVVPLLKDSADIIYMGKADQKGSRINNALDMILYGGEWDLSPEEAMTNLMTDPVKKAKSMLNIQKQDIDKEIYGVNTQRDRLKEMRRKIEDWEKSVEQLERRYEQEKLAGRTWNLNWIKQDIKETKKAQEWLEKYLQDNGSVPTKEELEVEIKKLDEEIEKFEGKKKEINEADKNGMLDKLVKDITEEYNRNNSSIKDYNAYLEDLKKDYAEAHRFGSKAELKQYLEDKKNGVLATDKNRVTSWKTMAARASRPSIRMNVEEREKKNPTANPMNKVTSKKPTQNAPMKFSPELVEKVDKLAEERGLEWNTIKKMKVLNKTVDKGKWYQTETEKEIYNLKKQIIIEYVKSKWRTIKDKWQKKTIVDIKQWKTRVHWHVVGKLYRDLKREWIIK